MKEKVYYANRNFGLFFSFPLSSLALKSPIKHWYDILSMAFLKNFIKFINFFVIMDVGAYAWITLTLYRMYFVCELCGSIIVYEWKIWHRASASDCPFLDRKMYVPIVVSGGLIQVFSLHLLRPHPIGSFLVLLLFLTFSRSMSMFWHHMWQCVIWYATFRQPGILNTIPLAVFGRSWSQKIVIYATGSSEPSWTERATHVFFLKVLSVELWVGGRCNPPD